MKKTSLLAAVVALVMLLSVSLGSTLAYFTATDKKDTTAPVTLGASSHIHEDIDPETLIKSVTVTNDGETEIKVRVMISGSYFTVSGWGDIHEDGYYYYDPVLEPGESSSVLTITPDLAAAAQAQAGFSIVVTEEYGQVVEIDGEKTVDWISAEEVK